MLFVLKHVEIYLNDFNLGKVCLQAMHFYETGDAEYRDKDETHKSEIGQEEEEAGAKVASRL